MKLEVDFDGDLQEREDDEVLLSKWELQDQDFLWGPVSSSKKWAGKRDRFATTGQSVPPEMRSPDVVRSSSGTTGDASSTVLQGSTFRADTWNPLAELDCPAGKVTQSATVLHKNSMSARVLGLGLVKQESSKLPAILVHQIHESYVV